MVSRRTLTAMGGVFAAVVAAGTLMLNTISATPAAAASGGTGVGYLHTDGNKIVDSTGATVRLTGINWFGMETSNLTFHGLWAGLPATWTEQLQHMAQLGYNTIRVPYTGAAIKPGAAANSVNTATNPDLVGLSPLQILDKVVAYAGSLGMRVILDRHRLTPDVATALWYSSSVTEASEIADWQTLAQHFAGNTTVIGADVFNEPHADGTDPQGTGADWGAGDARDWRLGAQRIGNAILAANPNWLIFVEGVSCDLPSGGTANIWDSIPDPPLGCDWWGGNLALAGQFPVQLNVANRLVYSPHDYGLSVFNSGNCQPGQVWFGDPTFPNNLPAVWDHFWGYLYKQNIAPIMVGEFGSTLACPQDAAWMKALLAYMGTGVNGMSFTYWDWNPDSGDTGGIVGDDWFTVDQAKQSIVGPYLIPPVPNGSTPSPTGTPSVVPTTPTSAPPSSAPPSSRPPSSPPPSSPSTSSGPGGCTATYTTVNSWPGGFQAQVTVAAGSTAINGWTVTWTLASGQTISQLWNGALTTSGSAVTVKNLSYNGALAASASTNFGFQANGTPSTPTVTCTSS